MKLNILNLQKTNYYIKYNNVIHEVIPEKIIVRYDLEHDGFVQTIKSKNSKDEIYYNQYVYTSVENCKNNQPFNTHVEVYVEKLQQTEDCITTYIIDNGVQLKTLDHFTCEFKVYTFGVQNTGTITNISVKTQYYNTYEEALMFCKIPYVDVNGVQCYKGGELESLFLSDYQKGLITQLIDIFNIIEENNISVIYNPDEGRYYAINNTDVEIDHVCDTNLQAKDCIKYFEIKDLPISNIYDDSYIQLKK